MGCPNCGYCPHCGRGGHWHGDGYGWPQPLYPYYQPYYQPYPGPTNYEYDVDKLKEFVSKLGEKKEDDGNS